jgi:hypothetical protein
MGCGLCRRPILNRDPSRPIAAPRDGGILMAWDDGAGALTGRTHSFAGV